MLRHLRKKLQPIEVWGWCPRKSGDQRPSIFMDSRFKIGEILWIQLRIIEFMSDFSRLVLRALWMDLDDFWCILKLWSRIFWFWWIWVQILRGFSKIWCGSQKYLGISQISKSSALRRWIWMIFGAFWSSDFIFSDCDHFGYKSYVDFIKSDVDLWNI